MAWLGVARGLWTSVILSSYAAGTTVRGDSSTAISKVQYGRNVVADSRSLQSRPYWLLEKARPARPRAGEERSRQSQTRVGRSVEFWCPMSLLCLAAWFHSLLRSSMNRHDLLTSVGTLLFPMEHAMRLGVGFVHLPACHQGRDVETSKPEGSFWPEPQERLHRASSRPPITLPHHLGARRGHCRNLGTYKRGRCAIFLKVESFANGNGQA